MFVLIHSSIFTRLFLLVVRKEVIFSTSHALPILYSNASRKYKNGLSVMKFISDFRLTKEKWWFEGKKELKYCPICVTAPISQFFRIAGFYATNDSRTPLGPEGSNGTEPSLGAVGDPAILEVGV